MARSPPKPPPLNTLTAVQNLAEEMHGTADHWSRRLAAIAEPQLPKGAEWQARPSPHFVAVPADEYQALQSRLAKLAKKLRPLTRKPTPDRL